MKKLQFYTNIPHSLRNDTRVLFSMTLNDRNPNFKGTQLLYVNISEMIQDGDKVTT